MTQRADTIPYQVRDSLALEGIKIDLLGQPLAKDDLVLVKGYGSMSHDVIATIKRINKVNIVVEVPKTFYNNNAIKEWRDNNPGQYWWKAENRDQFLISTTAEMSRKPHDVIKFDKQAEAAKTAYNKLQNDYPEYYI